MDTFYSHRESSTGFGFKFTLISTLQLVVDIVMRILMVENPQPRPSVIVKSENTTSSVDSASGEDSSDSESSAMDDCHEQTKLLPPKIRQVKEQKALDFYICLFRHPRFLSAQFLYMLFSILLASLDATLPLHVQDTFGWSSFGAGMMFLGIQLPSVFLGPVFGWLRDRVGTRHPTWIAFALLAPTMWCMGIPGDARFPWAMEQQGQAVYIASVIGFGIFMNLLNGVGLMESKCKHPVLLLLPSPPPFPPACCSGRNFYGQRNLRRYRGRARGGQSGYLRPAWRLLSRLCSQQHELDDRNASGPHNFRM